jgi:hypothetical protein
MSDLIVKIGDDALDLSVDETIAITKQAAKVGDFSTVLADGTNEVTVPLTPKNQLIMDNAHLIPSDSAKPYGRLDATLIQEGYETIQDGYAIIKSSSDNFSVQVVGGNAGFFNLIKDLNLRDLPLTDYEHFWTNQECFDRRNETEGLIYAIFEQSLDDFTMDEYSPGSYAVNTDQFLPSFYRKTLIAKIFEVQGYTFVTDLETEDIYDKAIEFRAAIPNRGNDMSYHECTVRNVYPTNLPPFAPIDVHFFDTSTIDANTSLYASSAEFLSSLQFSAGKYLLTDSCTVTVDFSLIIENTTQPVYIHIDVMHTSADGLVSSQTDAQLIPVGTNTYNYSITFDCSEFEGEIYFTQYAARSDVFPVIILADSTYTVSNVELIANAPITSDFPFNYMTGETMVIDMKQGEYLKECAKMYQWVFDTDERTHTVTARRFDQIKDRTPQAIDLSDKIDARNIKITYGVDGFAQTNALRYKEDDTTKYDAVGYINVADTTLNAEKDYVKMSQFAASSTRLRFDTVNAPYVPMFEEELPTNGLTDRTLLVRRVTPFAANINFARVGDTPSNIPTDDVTFAYFAEAGNSDSLDFPTLIERFYQTVIDMNDRGKSIECDMNLNIKDVMNYDPLTPVYIQHFGNYFYWEKLSNYVKDKLTKCKFVKI